MKNNIRRTLNAINTVKTVKSTKDSVKDSHASEIESEIRRTYPQVKIRHLSKEMRTNNGSYHLIKLEFSNYPGEGATGFANDPRTAQEENWTKFLRHIYEKHIGKSRWFNVHRDSLEIYEDVKQHDSTDVDTCDDLDNADIDELIAEEYEAIADYQNALKTCDTESARQRLTHILEEEKEHVRELEQLKASKETKASNDFSPMTHEKLERLSKETAEPKKSSHNTDSVKDTTCYVLENLTAKQYVTNNDGLADDILKAKKFSSFEEAGAYAKKLIKEGANSNYEVQEYNPH